MNTPVTRRSFLAGSGVLVAGASLPMAEAVARPQATTARGAEPAGRAALSTESDRAARRGLAHVVGEHHGHETGRKTQHDRKLVDGVDLHLHETQPPRRPRRRDRALEGRGPAHWIEEEIVFSGGLHLWAETEGDLDLALRVESDAGELLAEDEDSGGGRTPTGQPRRDARRCSREGCGRMRCG